ncbi:MAG TPA: DoxX family membrane protein, partial [Bryobacteraceae bacterium]
MQIIFWKQTLMTLDNKLHSSWWALRIVIGLAAFLAGLDKFFNILVNWSMYLSPFTQHVLPIDGNVFLRLIGIIEMIVGLAILTRWTRIGAYIASAWWLLIAVNLVIGGFFDVAVRDIEISIAAFVLARMTEARQPEAVAERAPEARFRSDSSQAAKP